MQGAQVLRIIRHVPLPALPVVAVGGRPQAQVGLALPVAGVVYGEIAGAGEVGDLVLNVSLGPHGGLQHFELAGGMFLVYRLGLAGFHEMGQSGAFFNGQGIAGHVGDAVFKSSFQVFLPVAVAGGGRAVDEVDGQVVKAGGECLFQAGAGLAGIVGAVEKLQVLFKEGLDADAQAVDGCAAQGGDLFFGQVVGVGLQGDLGARFEGIVFSDLLEKAHEFALSEQAGGAAAVVDAVERFAFQVAVA